MRKDRRDRTTVISTIFQYYGGSGSSSSTLAPSLLMAMPAFFQHDLRGRYFQPGDSAGQRHRYDLSGTTITTAGWTITDSGTEVTLEESLEYSGILTVQSGATLTLANDSTLTVTHLTGSDATVVIDAGSSLINEATGVTYGPGTYNITEVNSACYCRGTLIALIAAKFRLRHWRSAAKCSRGRARCGRSNGSVDAVTAAASSWAAKMSCRFASRLARLTIACRGVIFGYRHIMPCISTVVLIEAKDLVNGMSIMQADRVEKVEYFHIELETHDVIIADGA